MKLVVDSSVFISALGIEDVYTIPSKDFFKTIANEQIILPTLVVAEIMTALIRQKSANLHQILKYLLNIPLITLDEKLIIEMINITPKILHLKTSDVIMAISAKKEGAILVTWDKQLLKYAPAICSAKLPKKYSPEVKETKQSFGKN